MTWTTIAITYGAFLLGVALGWFVCAALSIAGDADDEDELNGWWR